MKAGREAAGSEVAQGLEKKLEDQGKVVKQLTRSSEASKAEIQALTQKHQADLDAAQQDLIEQLEQAKKEGQEGLKAQKQEIQDREEQLNLKQLESLKALHKADLEKVQQDLVSSLENAD